MGGGGGGGGKEGDWECSSCCNRNYAFRSFCNRCKQPRLLVDTKTPADSKWLPRIGDWICTGCTNNNYASREKCKKCGQPKEVAAMPAVAIHGASVSTHPTYFSRTQGVEQMVNVGSLQQSLSLGSSYLLGGVGNYGTQPFGLHRTSSWLLGGNNVSGFPFSSQTNQRSPVSDGNEWRSGDWMCTCGFHNYSSRVQCKKCDAPAPIVTPSSLVSTAVTALGTKRMATEEIHDWDNKRLNAGHAYGLQQSYPGTKPWRDGDWMCSNCNNHNYASRAQCNRCKSDRETPGRPVSV